MPNIYDEIYSTINNFEQVTNKNLEKFAFSESDATIKLMERLNSFVNSKELQDLKDELRNKLQTGADVEDEEAKKIKNYYAYQLRDLWSKNMAKDDMPRLRELVKNNDPNTEKVVKNFITFIEPAAPKLEEEPKVASKKVTSKKVASKKVAAPKVAAKQPQVQPPVQPPVQPQGPAPQIEPENINKPQENNNENPQEIKIENPQEIKIENPQEIKIENPQEQPENKIEDKPEIINEQPELKAKEEQKDILHADAPAQKKFTIADRLKDAKLQSKNAFKEYVSFDEDINDLIKEKEEIKKSRPARNVRHYEERKSRFDDQITYIENTTNFLYSEQNSASQSLKKSILEIQALLTLKETLGEKHEITQDELDEAVKNEGFTAVLLEAPYPARVIKYSLIVDKPEKLHELSKEGSQLLPGVDKSNLWTTYGLFGRETPTTSDTNGYHTGRTAIDSFAMLYFADKHKQEINEGKYTIDDFFSPDKLKERQKAYDEVWTRIQQADHAWLAQHVYEGYLVLLELCEKTAKQLDWTSPDLYRDPKYQMMAMAQGFLFDADQEIDAGNGCPTAMLRYIKKNHDHSLKITADSEKNKDRLHKYWEDKKLILPIGGLYGLWSKIYMHSASIMLKKKFENDKIDIEIPCQMVAANMEAIIETSNRFIAHESLCKMIDSFDDMEPKKISEKAKYFGFTDDKIPEIFNKLDNESKQEIFDKLDDKSKQEIFDKLDLDDKSKQEIFYKLDNESTQAIIDKLDNESKQAINNDDQIKNMDAWLAIETDPAYRTLLETRKNTRISELIRQPSELIRLTSELIRQRPKLIRQCPELIRMPSELIRQNSEIIRPYAEKKFLTDLFPTVPVEYKQLLGSLDNGFLKQLINMQNVVKADPTGSVGRNMLNDFLSGEFSKMNGGHDPVSMENLWALNIKFKDLQNVKQLAAKYKMPEQVKKDIWENKLASDYLKFKHTACAFADDLQNEDERNETSEDCTKYVLEGKNRPQGQYLETKIANDYLKYKEKYKELNTEGQNPRFLGDGGKPIIDDATQLYSFDRDNQEAVYDELKSNLQSDMRRDSDAKINKIRDTAIKLIDTPSEDYTRAMFRNSHLMEIEPLSSETLNIKVPSKTLRQELGKDTFNKLANIRIQANEEILTAVETEKLLARSSEERKKDKEAERKQLDKIWSVHQKTLLAYEALSRIDIDSFSTGDQKNRLSNDKGKMEQNKPAMLSNNLTELTENSKGTKSAIGWIKGEKKAIENGWGLEELGLLGMIGRLEEASKGALPKNIQKNEDARSQQKEFHKAVLKLKEEVWFKPIRNNKDKKDAAQKIRQFIAQQKTHNPLTPEMFNGLPMENITTALTAVDNLPHAEKAQNEFNDQEQVTKHLTSAIKTTTVPMRILDALIEVSQKNKTNERDHFLSWFYERTKHGKDNLQKLARCLEESIGELKKNINERIDQVSQDYLENPGKVDERYRKHIGCSTLRKQLALDSLSNSDMIKRLNEYIKLENDLLTSPNLPEKLRNNMNIEIQKKRAQHAGDRSYQFNSEEKFSQAIQANGKFNLNRLRAETIKQVESLGIYTAAMNDIARQARSHIEPLERTLTNQNDLSQRSGEFVRMLNSFKQVSELNEQKTPEQIEKAISEMIAASQEYIKKNDGLFKSTDGRNRLNAAKDMMRLGTHAQNHLIYGKKKDPITNESINLSKLCFDRNKSLADNQSAFVAAYNKANQPLDDYFASSNRPHLDDGSKEGQPNLQMKRRNNMRPIGKH